MCGEEGTWEISASSSHFSHESLNKSAKLNTQQQFIYISLNLYGDKPSQ